LLVAGALGGRTLDLYLQYDRPLEADELARFKERLRRRARREPLQYIEGRAAFRELNLAVDRRVLIPRPETEVLVEEVLRWAASRPGASVLDVGTGTGAIALSLALEGSFSRVVATDASPAALEVARSNAQSAGLADRVEFREGPLYVPVEGERFDVIVSNPPYIGEEEAQSLPPEVSDWEPHEALFAGVGGLEVIEALVSAAPSHLAPGGLLALEIGERQAEQVSRAICYLRAFREPVKKQDLSGRDRFVLAELDSEQEYST
jgi:release factor glutamine methyltransferase